MNARPALAVIGDVHLDLGEPAVGEFVALLARLDAPRIVLLGDLFNLWIGRRALERPHQRAVAQQLAELRRARGTVVRYVEGNRDYRIGEAYAGSAFDDVTADTLVEHCGGRRVLAAHGDLVNPADRQYRAWRRASRSRVAWAAFRLTPRPLADRLAGALERAMRRTNREFKREFPEAAVRRFAAPHFRAGHDLVVLGHFHVERRLQSRAPDPSGEILVLPEWKGSRRHLEIGDTGEVRFVSA